MKKYFIFGTDACEAYHEMKFKKFVKEFYNFYFDTNILALEGKATNLKACISLCKDINSGEYQEITEKQYNVLTIAAENFRMYLETKTNK